ncbi:hypothetical protein [Nostoc sp. UIC 10630]|nr:hypothetical protein [Nostoc sp. UIC 10630]
MVISPFGAISCFGCVFCPARTATLDISVKAGIKSTDGTTAKRQM